MVSMMKRVSEKNPVLEDGSRNLDPPTLPLWQAMTMSLLEAIVAIAKA
jgi:hypothetical protein